MTAASAQTTGSDDDDDDSSTDERQKAEADAAATRPPLSDTTRRRPNAPRQLYSSSHSPHPQPSPDINSPAAASPFKVPPLPLHPLQSPPFLPPQQHHQDHPRRPRASSHTGVARANSPQPPPSPASLRSRHGASSSFSHVNTHRLSFSSLGLCPDPFWTPLSSILRSLPQSPLPPSAMFTAANTQAPPPQAQNGPDLDEIQTESIGFLALAGESRIRLLPTPWPESSLPKPTSSLLSVASRNELVAAAGPAGLVIASTVAVREAYSSSAPAENNIKPFTPQLSIETPTISQVAFSSDESSLVICAQQGGGLAVYDVQAVRNNGEKNPAFQLGTNGTPVRALVPNPAPDSAHLFAIVLDSGQLVMADLQKRALAPGANSSEILKDGVSCVSWSAKGKQLVAGLDNGTAVQMTPNGTVQAQIPKCPQLPENSHVSCISWLDNDHFLIIYTPTNFELDHPPDSAFIYVSREPKTTNFMFQKLPDPVPPFGMNRSPPHHFISRLRNFPPALEDTLLLASTASGDVGLITCSKNPLSPTAPQTASKYTTTGIAEDTRKAQMPPNDAMMDTSPIGMALDLSSKDLVKRPIPSDEMDSSATPLPNLMMLNNEGILCSWWFVYSESIKQREAFPGLVAVAGNNQQQTQPSSVQAPSAFGMQNQQQSMFGAASPMGNSASPFGQQPNSAFGTPSKPAAAAGGPSAFGAAGAMGSSKSPWASAGATSTAPQAGSSAFGKPTFGSSTPISGGSGFGAVGGLGNRASPWATGSQNQQSSDNKPANPFSSTSAASPFSSIGQQSNDKALTFGSAFGNTSATSGFASLSQQTPSKSLFGAAPTTAAPDLSTQQSFASTMTIGSNFGSSFGGPSTLGEPRSAWGTPSLSNNNSAGSGNKSAFGSGPSPEAEMTSEDMDNDMETEKPAEKSDKKPDETSFGGLFANSGAASSGFKLGSTFKANSDSKDDSGAAQSSGPSLFGASFGAALGDAQKSTPTSISDASAAAKLPTLPSAETEKTKDKGKANEASPFSFNLNRNPQEQGPKPTDFDLSKVKVEAQDQPDGSQRQVLPDESKQEAVPSKANSDSSWETVQKSPTALDADVDPAPLPPSPPPPTSRRIIEEPPLPPAPSPSRKQVVDDAPLPPSPPSTTPARQVQGPDLFSTTPAGPLPRSPSPKKPMQIHELMSTTPTAPPPVKSSPAPPRSVSKPLFPQRPSRLSSAEESPARAETRSATTAHEPVDEYVDDSDIKIQEELASTIEPTKRLAPFIAHQDYVGRVPGQGVAAQIEKVYRDIQSMIDTLGLNARSLKAFTAGHEHFSNQRLPEDLEPGREDDWCLVEIEDLAIIEKGISGRLDEQRLQGARGMVAELQAMQKALAKLRTRHHGLQQLIRACQNADRPGGDHSQSVDDTRNPLTAEQSVILVDLRKAFTEFQTLLAQAEDSLTELRAKLASAPASRDRDYAGSSPRVPTFEAVSNTIAKMTRMVEQKSGDVDLLESQMRKLRFRPGKSSFDASGSLDEVLGRLTLGASTSAEQGRFQTPPGSRGKASAQSNSPVNTRGSGAFRLSYESQSDEDDYEILARPSPNSKKARKSKVNVSQDQVAAYAAMANRREKVLAVFRKKVCEAGTHVQGP